jgi:putative methylase
MESTIGKKQLEIILSKLKPHERPKPRLEQYTIPSRLAGVILHIAKMNGDIIGKAVADFGCGTARLAIGASLLGAREVTAIDVDSDCLKTAKENAKIAKQLTGIETKIKFVHKNIEEFGGRVDTVIQNPPFGIQNMHADRAFLKKAIECGNRIYSLHKDGYEKTVKFLTKFIDDCGASVKGIKKFKFNLPYTFKFHSKPKYSYNVDLYIIENRG